MKNIRKIAALVMALVMLLGTLAFAEETEDNLLLLTVNGNEIRQNDVIHMAQGLYENGYAQTPDDYLAAIDLSINVEIEEMLIKNLGADQFTQEELDAFRAEAQQMYDETFQEYLGYFQNDEELTEEEQKSLEKQVQDYLSSLGYTVDVVDESLRYNASFERVMDHLKEEYEIAVTDEEVKAVFAEIAESDRQLYENNAADYEMAVNLYGSESWYMPEGYRSVIQILLPVDEALLEDYQTKQAAYEEAASAEEGTETENAVTAEEVEAARQAILDSCRETMDEIFARLEKGEKFIDLIPEYNIDPGMTDPSLLEEGYMVHPDSVMWDSAFVQAAFDEKMQKPGDVSNPAVGSYGIYILYYLRDVPGGMIELDEDIYNYIETSLINQKMVPLYQSVVEKTRTETEIVYNEENLEKFAGIKMENGVLTIPAPAPSEEPVSEEE